MSNQIYPNSCSNCSDTFTNPANEPCKSCNGDSNWSSIKKKSEHHFPDTGKMMDVEQFYDWWMENKRERFTSARKTIIGFASDYFAYVTGFNAGDDKTLHWEKTEQEGTHQ